MPSLNHRDLWAGVVLVAFGGVALALGADLTVGSAADMGEGYVPRMMALALVVLGALVAVGALRPGAASAESRFDAVRGRSIVFVTLAVLAFAATLQTLGVIIAIALSCLSASFAGHPLAARPLAILIALLSAGVILIFVWGLGLPLTIFPTVF